MMVKNYRRVRAEPVVGEPGVTVRWLVSELSEAPGFALRLYEVEAGAAATIHTHFWEQAAFVVSGLGTVIGDEGEMRLREGDIIYIPSGGERRFTSAGRSPFRFLLVLPIVHQAPVQAE
jgi:quercetin dioxygenase-like cupin family protein